MIKKIMASALAFGMIGATIPSPAQANDGNGSPKHYKHVLLISIDGLHALDVATYVHLPGCPEHVVLPGSKIPRL